MKEHYLLGEVSRVLGRKPHQIVHLLTSGKIAEPQQRISNKRLFTEADITRLARHFKVTPKWAVMESTPDGGEDNASQGLVLKPPYEVLQVSETGHEIRDGDGEVFAWAPDRGRALLVAGLLEAATRG
jgi:hypothetical protein